MKKIIVQKFGGTSVADIDKINQEIISRLAYTLIDPFYNQFIK